jgi:hypothetical protein
MVKTHRGRQHRQTPDELERARERQRQRRTRRTPDQIERDRARDRERYARRTPVGIERRNERNRERWAQRKAMKPDWQIWIEVGPTRKLTPEAIERIRQRQAKIMERHREYHRRRAQKG